MKALDPLVQAWARRPGRERLLLAVVSLAALLALADALWTAPLAKRIQRSTGQLQTAQERIAAALTPAAGQPGAAELREREARLRQRLQQAQAGAAALRQRVGESARLPETLRAITTTVGSARLLELDLSGEGVVAGPPAAAASAPLLNTARKLYRLPIKLEVAGQWDELQLLLQQIERHADNLQWSSVTLDGRDWPSIRLTLQAHVMSLDPRWGASS